MNAKKKKMSLFGVGPLLFALTLPWFGLTVYFTWRYPDLFSFDPLPLPARRGLAVFLFLLTLALYLPAGFQIKRCHREGRLCTSGAYRFCRHPLYGAWCVFGIPAIALFFNSWLLGTTAFFMALCLRLTTPVEEKWLARNFGTPYEEYRARTPWLLPLGFLKK